MSSAQPTNVHPESNAFDPYHRWLGIRGGQSPPNHYRLLGLELWEADEVIIRDAFSRQTNHVKQFRNSGQREICERVLEELRSARDTLVEARLKSAYDRWLKLSAAAPTEQGGAAAGAGQPFAVHSDVPAVATNRAVACANCGTENTGARKFCGGCGASLWEPCIECGVLCGPSDLHCGGCGVNIASAVQKRVQAFQAVLDDATNLVQQGLTELAVETVEQAMLSEHPRLAALTRRAEQLVLEAQSARVRFDQLVDSSLAEAKTLSARGDFQEAAIILKSLPVHLHSETVLELLAEIDERQLEAARLIAEVQQALAQKQFDGLLSKVNRLLELKPDPQIQNLQQRLSERETKRAEAQKNQLSELAAAEVQRHGYAKAAELLRQIPEDQLSPETVKQIEKVELRAAEVEWLDRDLRNAAIYDEHLLPIAERLQKLQPNDKMAQKFVEVLRVRQSGQAPTASISWPRLPPKGQWGFPIELFSGFKRVTIEQKDSPVLKNPEMYCVAIGLALQGLNKAVIDTNLAPAEKRGLFGLLKSKKRNYKTAWGIDLGQSALKAVQVAFVPATEQITVVNAKRIPLSTNAEFNGGPAELMQLAMKAFLEQCDLTGSAVCVSFPTRKMVNRMFDLPKVEAKKIPEIMQYEVKQHIPLPLETVAWDYQILEPTAAQKDDDGVAIKPVALCGAKLEDVQAHLAPFSERSINVDVLQSDAAALYNFAAWEQQLPNNANGGGKQVAVVLEVGASSTNVVVSDGHTFSMRGIPLGGNDFARALAREFRLTREQSEKLKRAPTAAPYLHQVYGALAPVFQNLATEAWQPVDQYLLQDTRRTKHKLLLVGGETKLHGLLKYLCHGE